MARRGMLEQVKADEASPAGSNEPSDEELEARWKAGSSPAFAMLFERYHTRIFSFAMRLTRDRHLAEDLAQRAFLNLYKKPPPGTGRASFKSLLFTVVRNESLNEIKRRGRRKEASLEAVGEGKAPGETPAERVDKQEQQARLSEALGQLPEDEREIVLLREAEGLTFREICEVTGLSRDAIRWRLARGMERLREVMGGGAA
jgi:RNA polymerase sigma-70 factor (ECF subfamily)